MQVKPIPSPAVIQQPASKAADFKAKAIAAFNQGAQQPAQQVVQNQNQVSPEEMSAIQPQTGQSDQLETKTEETSEVAVTTEEVKPQEDPAVSKQFAQLARQEKAMRIKAQQQDQAMKAREAAVAAKEAELANRQPQDMSRYISIDQLKNDPLGVLSQAQVSYDELTQQIVSQVPVDPRMKQTISSLEKQIQELKQANEDAKKSQADGQNQAYQAAIKQIKMDATNLVNKDPSFEAIKATGSVKDVVDLIEQTYHKDGIVLTVEEAAQQVEDYLVEEGLKIAQINKIKQKMQAVAPKASTSTAQTPAAKPQQQQPMKTLTNATSSQRQLSAKERAILAFKGELKS